MERRRAASVTLRATLERFFVKTLLAVERGVGAGMRSWRNVIPSLGWVKFLMFVHAVRCLQNATFVTGENIRVDGGGHAAW